MSLSKKFRSAYPDFKDLLPKPPIYESFVFVRIFIDTCRAKRVVFLKKRLDTKHNKAEK
jgi:hypothetical protein